MDELAAAPLGQERMRLIEAVSSKLSNINGYDSALQVGARCALPELADLAVLFSQPNGADSRLEVAHVHPEREPEITGRLSAALPLIRQASERDIRSGRRFRWIPVVTPASLRFLHRVDPRLEDLIRTLQVQSLLVVPLRSGGRHLGAMALARTTPDQPYHAADLSLAQVVARRVAGAIESAALNERARDVEARSNRLEDALRKWIRVFDLAGWGAAIVDAADQRIDAVNPAFALLHRYPNPDSLKGLRFTDLLPADHIKEIESWDAKPVGQAGAYESVHLRADGTRFPVWTNVTAMELGPGITSYVVTVQDLTELKRAEDRTRSAQRLEAVGRLAGGVAHEVNNMMTIVIGFSDLLAAAKNLPQNRQREVEEIRRAATRAAGITQQLLAFSRKQILQPLELNLNQIVAEMTPVLRLLLPASVEVETVLAPDTLVVHADRAQLEQVLINLAFNARDAMPSGGKLRLIAESRWLEESDGQRHIGIPITPGHYALVSVADTGHGMDRATIEHVFEPFFTTKPLGAGTGLGLASVYGIVKQSGGYVWLESSPGVGTTVTVSLPVVYRAEPPETGTSPAERPGRRRTGDTVLVVEDEEVVRELSCRVLQEEGFRTLEGRNAEQVTERLQHARDQIDLILSDVVLPGMAPVELEQLIHHLGLEIPILYMSGYSGADVISRGLIQGGRPFLQKPFSPEELVAAVCRQLEGVSQPVVDQ